MQSPPTYTLGVLLHYLRDTTRPTHQSQNNYTAVSHCTSTLLLVITSSWEECYIVEWNGKPILHVEWNGKPTLQGGMEWEANTTGGMELEANTIGWDGNWDQVCLYSPKDIHYTIMMVSTWVHG